MAPEIITTINESQAGILALAILILLLAALVGAKIAAWLTIPKVAGEIIGGLLIGPTFVGHYFPDLYSYVFFGFAAEGQVISTFYWLGLIFLMFTSGYEANLRDFKNDRKIIGWLIAGSTIIPLLAGYYISDRWFARHYVGEAGNTVVFNLIFAIATAVTSIPVISKIFLDLGLIQHRYAKIILSTATIQDLFLWVILSIAGSILTHKAVVAGSLVLHLGMTAAMFAFAMYIAPVLGRFKAMEKLAVFSYDSIYFILCFLCIYLGSLFGINIMYTAFVSGLIFKNIRNDEASRAQVKVKDMCLAFFTPVYFAIVGLRIHITSDFNIGRFIVFMLIVSAIELLGCVIAMRIIRVSWLASFNLGIAMNARGGPGIVLATVTYDMGIINYEFFCVLVFTTLITSAVAGWWIGYINKKGKLLTL